MSSTGEQLIASAYTFGAAALAFASLPFLFCILRALMKANEPSSNPGGIFGTFLFAFAVHFVSCIMFMGAILILDMQTALNEDDARYFTNKVFPLFWNEDVESIKQVAGLKEDNIVASGSVSILVMVQTIRKWIFLLLPIFVLFLGVAYGVYMLKKDTYKQNGDYITLAFWTMGSSIVAFILFLLWCKIADFALFINGADDRKFTSIEGYIIGLWEDVLQISQ